MRDNETYYEKNKKKLRKQHKEYYLKNKTILNNNAKKYYKENKEIIKKRIAEKNGYLTDKQRLKKCLICGVSFVGKTRKNKICDKQECKKIYKNRKSAENRRKRGEVSNGVKYVPLRRGRKRKCNKSKDIYHQFHRYKLGARRRNIEFNLKYNDFKKLWRKNCYYCGGKINKIGIDRIDNNNGYVISNIIPCCTNCNSIKAGDTVMEFKTKLNKKIDLCKRKMNHYEKILSNLY